MEQLKVGDLVEVTGSPKARSMSAKEGAIAIVVKAPRRAEWNKRITVLDVLWLDKRASNQMNGAYEAKAFVPLSDEQSDAVYHGTPSQRRATINIAVLEWALKAARAQQ